MGCVHGLLLDGNELKKKICAGMSATHRTVVVELGSSEAKPNGSTNKNCMSQLLQSSADPMILYSLFAVSAEFSQNVEYVFADRLEYVEPS